MNNHDGKSIAFGIFDMDDTLIGWRQDTFNTLGFPPKIYTYSDSQVETVLKNIQESMDGKGQELMEKLGVSENILTHVIEHEQALRDLGEYRVKIYEIPPIEGRTPDNPWGEYPDLDMWKLSYAGQAPLKTYRFRLKRVS